MRALSMASQSVALSIAQNSQNGRISQLVSLIAAFVSRSATGETTMSATHFVLKTTLQNGV